MYLRFKRLFEFIVALVLSVILLPLFVVVGLLIKLGSRGPIFYTQERLGYRGETFKLYKFRSMTNKKRDEFVQVTNNSAEVTAIGKFIRRFKIDELPQLLNVLNGDMSLVGPRPCLPSMRESFNEDGEKRILVRPGLTGMAQVNGNILLSWEERWRFDRHYVENVSLLLDIQILYKTVLIVFLGEQWGKK